MTIPRALPFLTSLVFLLACSPSRTCTPGASVACVGAGGCAGGQVCNAEGTGFAACDCSGPMVDASVPPDAPGAPDAGVDADPSDGGPETCDPITQAPCDTGQRCAWVRITPELGAARCVPSGAVAEGDPCTSGPDGETTGYDDCARGLTCASGVCREICSFSAPTPCGAEGECTRYWGLFANGEDDPPAGACNPTCDPLTGMPCAAGQGCYMLASSSATLFVCAPAGTTAIGSTVVGTTYANSCVPGALGIRRTSDGATLCVPWCRPVDTHSGAPGGANGMSPYSCAEVGGGGSDACLFSWFLSGSDTFDPRLNERGFCVPPGAFAWDDDMMAATPNVPFPSCTTLSNGDSDGDGFVDHLFFGCGPRPAP